MTDSPLSNSIFSPHFSGNSYSAVVSGPVKLELELLNGQQIQILGSSNYQQLVDTQKNMKIGLIILGIVCGILFLLLIFMFHLLQKK